MKDTEFYVSRHIRGRVFFRAPAYRSKWGTTRASYGMQVVNTRTGKVLIEDDCTDWRKVVEACEDATRVARAAYFWSLKHKALRP